MRLRTAISVLLLVSAAFAADATALNDGVDRNDPNFVKASLVVASPGEQLFSCAGHACLRLECPTFKLENCYSYESENVRDRVLTFFAGKLKMGMFSIPTSMLLGFYKEDGRGVRQYALNLPPEIKQRLWKVLDERVAQGVNLPYDYVNRGCAWSVLGSLREALDPIPLVHPAWSVKYNQTRREIIGNAIADFPWTRFAIHAIVGSDVDFGERNLDKVVLPEDIVEFLQGAKLGDVFILSRESEELLPVQTRIESVGWFTPMALAVIILVLSLLNCLLKIPLLDWIFLSVQTIAGIFFTYLVIGSSLPATTWNWLIVPFNLLPLVFWKWRRRWAFAFAGVLAIWEVGMLLSPHRLTDPAYLVIVLAYIVFYLKIAFQGKCLLFGFKSGRRKEGECI